MKLAALVQRIAGGDHWHRSGVVDEYATYDYLEPAEETVLHDFRPRIAEGRLLDLGVGAGRTAVHFAPIAREYVGVDFSPEMIDACRRRFADSGWDHATFAVADARDLEGHEDASYDAVLFSYNGLDCVGRSEDRVRALREVRRVLKPGGRLAFSAQNLDKLGPVFSLRHNLAEAVKFRLMNPGYRPSKRAPAAAICDERFGLSFPRTYWLRPSVQLRQLSELGFDDVRVVAPRGEELAPDAVAGRSEPWFYFVASKSSPNAS